MTKVNIQIQINKSTYDNLEVEEVALEGDRLRVEWGLAGDEENTASYVDKAVYAEWLNRKGYLVETFETFGSVMQRQIDFNTYWTFYDHSVKCEHMRQYLSCCHSPKKYSVNDLKQLAKTA